VRQGYDAVVVGSGPNGLAAAITLARAGRRVVVLEAQPTFGGGARSAELTRPGFIHDTCSAIHPMGVASPLFRALGLERFGLEWCHPRAPLAHPLDDGTAAVLYRSIEETAATLGPDGKRWERLFRGLIRDFDVLSETFFRPVFRLPRAPLILARFGFRAWRSAQALAEGLFTRPHAKALFAGCAAHSFAPLDQPFTASFGLVLALLGHAVGWPSPKGGTQKLSDALVACLRSVGGQLRANEPITALDQLPPARAVLFDTTPWQLARIAADALPEGFRQTLLRFRRGPGVFKLDYALDGPMPWKAAACAHAGTLHLGGTHAELAESEAQTNAGLPPARPYLLVAQHTTFDRSRAPDGKHTLWAYCHTPNGSAFDMTERMESQLERFAPGFRRLVLARRARTPADFAAANLNQEGGDISGGAIDGLQLFFRPRVSLRPWRTPNPRLFLCSASTPPGPAVHGMCGYWAAREALNTVLAG
jgi:phytoene dehydrogenase-like protein